MDVTQVEVGLALLLYVQATLGHRARLNLPKNSRPNGKMLRFHEFTNMYKNLTFFFFVVVIALAVPHSRFGDKLLRI